jgi:hypothetical protein
MRLEFSGEVVFWRGPAAWFFVRVPEEECRMRAGGASDD